MAPRPGHEPELVIPEVVRLPGVEPREPDPAIVRLDRWRRASAVGALVTAGLVGLQEALEDKRPPEIVEIADAAGEPDEPLALDLDPDDPAASIAVLRHRGVAG